MPEPIFTHGMELVVPEILREMEFEAFHASPFKGMVSEVVTTKEERMAGLTQDPPIGRKTVGIKKTLNFRDEETSEVIVGQVRRLTGPGRAGDQTLRGFEEPRAVYRRSVHVNVIRHAVPIRVGRMDAIRDPFKIARYCKDLLKDHLSNTITWYGIVSAIYEKSSFHITRTDSALQYADRGGGLGLGRRHPRNIYVAGVGDVTHSCTHATHDASLNTALTTLDATAENPSSDQVFSANLVRIMRARAVRNLIEQVILDDGHSLWLCFLPPDVFAQAQADETILRATERAYAGQGIKDPILSGSYLIYNGFALIENMWVGTEVHRDTGNVRPNSGATAGWRVLYGPMNDADTQLNAEGKTSVLGGLESSATAATAGYTNLKASVILGKNAFSIGSMPLKMVMQTDDYEYFKGVGYEYVYGVEVNNDYDNLANPTVIENHSSYVVITNSPRV